MNLGNNNDPEEIQEMDQLELHSSYRGKTCSSEKVRYGKTVVSSAGISDNPERRKTCEKIKRIPELSGEASLREVLSHIIVEIMDRITGGTA